MSIVYAVVVNSTDDATKPRPILGWQRYDSITPPPAQAAGSLAVELPQMADAAWPPLNQPQTISNLGLSPEGQIVSCPQAAYVPPLKEQAQAAMQSVQQRAGMMFAMGQTFGPAMRTYVQKLQAIIEGTDKTSLVLPAAPADATT